MLLSASRDKTLIIWDLTRDETAYGYPKRSLKGHSHIVSDCVCLSEAPRNEMRRIKGDELWRERTNPLSCLGNTLTYIYSH